MVLKQIRESKILDAKGNPIRVAVEVCFAHAETGENVAEAVRAVFAGVPAAKRDEVRAALYDAIRETDGRDAAGKLRPARELTERTRRAYEAARQAVRRLFPSTKADKKKKGKAIIIPLDRKGISGMCKAAISAIQSAESLPYDAAKAVAAWQALAEICGIQKKPKQ